MPYKKGSGKGNQMIKLLTVPQVAEILHKHPGDVARWCRAGVLEATKIGNVWRIKQTAVRKMIDEGSNQKKEEQET